jgi:hypothetical protein
MGIAVKPFQDMSVFLALGMFGQDAARSMEVSVCKGTKLVESGIDSTVGNRPLDELDAVHAHGDRSALAAEVGAQLLLGLDGILEHRVADGLAGDDKGPCTAAWTLRRHPPLPGNLPSASPFLGEEGI